MDTALFSSSSARATLMSATLHPAMETAISGTRSAMDFGTRASMLRPMCNTFSVCSSSGSRGPLESVACGSSSSGRDGGASCCIPTPACYSSRLAAKRCERIAADFGWRICSSGLLSLDARRNLYDAVPRKRLPLRVSAEKPDLTNVAGTLLRLGKQGLEAGTNLVPEAVPRPVAQAGVGLAGVVLASFLLKSLFSTLTFILAIGALSYAAYFFFTQDKGSSSSSEGGDGSSSKSKSSDDALEEARRIMEKYK